MSFLSSILILKTLQYFELAHEGNTFKEGAVLFYEIIGQKHS